MESTEGMFSAASFAGVLSKYEEREWIEPETTALETPPIIAFYGFRGGAGRTTSMAHVAALLAARRVNVVAVDLDLEAPGLHHVLACPEPDEDRGALALLRAAAMADEGDLSQALRLAPHIVKSRLDIGSPIRVLPAGRLSDHYLIQLDDLAVPLWHMADGPSPLELLMRQIKEELSPQVICLDCRTGLSGLSASAMFHVADVVVCFLPVSEQSFDGLDIFLKALKAAKLARTGKPEAIIVPSMVPEGPEGRQRLEEWFLPHIEERYCNIILGVDPAESAPEQIPIVREGIEYRRGIALAGPMRLDFVQRSNGIYQPLMQRIEPLIGLGHQSTPVAIDARRVLDELTRHGNLKSLQFGEDTNVEEIVQKFIEPSDFTAIVDRTTWYVVGAKGAGKTWLWTYLSSKTFQDKSHDMRYVAALRPRSELLSPSVMKELESDKTVRMENRRMHGALWLLYAAWRILRIDPVLSDQVLGRFRNEEKRLLVRLVAADDTTFQSELTKALAYERASTLAERVLRAIDAELLENNRPAMTLLYDGLDVGFGSDEKSLQMRARYVNALVEAIEPFRGSSKRIFFKLFLREDIFAELTIQNQSHLDAAKIEVRWEPQDLWMLTLNLVAASPHYLEVIRGIDSTAGPGAWPTENERRLRLLVPLWGEQMERGNKISTAAFVQRRTADGKGRLFPRTLVQLLHAAVEHQATLEPMPDRVLRSAAIQEGYTSASAKRVADLIKEYDQFKSYFDGLRGMTPTGTESQIVAHIRKRMPEKARKTKGVEAGAYHAGGGGWHKVIARFLEIGVLREYKRARGDAGEQKYEIALLYRPGLGIKAFGV